ncbi:MAG: type II toxin-antitoxin system VapC family toxin [Candidatus Bipolaricaulia bacterium]
MRVFVDTWGWLSLRDQREDAHETVQALYRKYRSEGSQILTTDYVLDETFTLLFKRLNTSAALEAMMSLNDAVEQGYLQMERITPDRFRTALAWRRRYQDKPQISFTDLTSMVVMDELRIAEIMTNDQHFAQVGLGLRPVPA